MKSENQKLWESRIEAQRASGKSQQLWCKENGINYYNFQYWNRRVKQPATNSEANSVQFISLTPAKSSVINSMSITIGRIKLEWNEAIKAAELEQILQVINRYA